MKQIIIDLQNKIEDITITEDTEILGLFLGQARDNFSDSFRIRHSLPGLKSRIRIKAVLKDESSFSLEPILVIDRGAKGTDSYLKVDILVLSKNSRAKAIPSLEIEENDVKAGHGATIGRPDKEQLFYLQTRGLSRKQAEEVLIKAFIKDIIEATNKLKTANE